MDEHVNWNLLARYLFGECSDEEESEVQVWVEEDPRRKTLLDELRWVQDTTGGTPAQWDADAVGCRCSLEPSAASRAAGGVSKTAASSRPVSRDS